MKAAILLLVAALGCGTAKGDYRWNEYSLGSTASLRGISAYSADVVWVSGSEGAVFKTENRGASWKRVIVPGSESLDFRDVEVLSGSVVLLMSAGPGSRSTVLRSGDGGTSWAEVAPNHHEAGFYDGFAFWNDKEGILGGDPVDGSMYFLKTLDGGKTWQRVDPARLPALKSGESGGFAASGSHLATRGSSVWIGSAYAGSRVTLSRDKGDTWEVVDTPIIQAEKSQGIFSIAFFDEQTGVAVGGDHVNEDRGGDNVILTSDGGRTWRLGDEFPLFQSSVRYLGRTDLVSVGPAAGYVSDDGGLTWRRIEGNGYHALSVSPEGTVWAAGRDGRVARLAATPSR